MERKEGEVVRRRIARKEGEAEAEGREVVRRGEQGGREVERRMGRERGIEEEDGEG
jgi:hypothetical protein